VGQRGDDPAHVRLDQVVEEADYLAVGGVDLGGAVGHLHQQSPVAAQQQRQGGVGGDEVGVHPHAQHPQATGQVVLPHRGVPLCVAVAAEDVVDQDIQSAVLGPTRSTRAATAAGSSWSTTRAVPCPPAAASSSPVSSIVSGRPISERPVTRLLRPVAYTYSPARANSTAMVRPAPRVAPATSATRRPLCSALMVAMKAGRPHHDIPGLGLSGPTREMGGRLAGQPPSRQGLDAGDGERGDPA
jgi:hypothetical protein